MTIGRSFAVGSLENVREVAAVETSGRHLRRSSVRCPAALRFLIEARESGAT
ncbi:hypothetical protein [Kitasatospora sp. NPDC048538]|uniref:hypothetical protein n=1 Tax=unclassified Kitasatospora TaxID=2633591 RepID=UPI0033F60C43